jgi:hypothetical protein
VAAMKTGEWRLGNIKVHRGLVVWTMDADDARELAGFIEESITCRDDLALRDVADLRRAADEIAGES